MRYAVCGMDNGQGTRFSVSCGAALNAAAQVDPAKAGRRSAYVGSRVVANWQPNYAADVAFAGMLSD